MFNEAVTDFTNTDVDTSAATCAGPLSVQVIEIAPMNKTTYKIAISGMSGPGTVIAAISAGAAIDTAGNGNAASTTTDDTVAYDSTLDDIVYNLSASHTIIAEKDAGSTAIDFTITRSGATSVVSTVDFAIAGTATFGTDYNNIGGTGAASGLNGTIEFAIGELVKTITMDLLGDIDYEPRETIEITLSGASDPGCATDCIFNVIDLRMEFFGIIHLDFLSGN